MDGQTRRPPAEVRAAELAEHYARILGRQVDLRVSAVVRTCLRRLPARLPIRGGDRRAVEALIERVLRLGDVGSPDLVGASSQIDADIARRLGEAAGDPRGVYRALRAMLGHTALVVRHSRQIWELRLAGLADATSEVHRALVAETPALYCLPTPDAVPTEPAAAEQAQVAPPDSDRSAELLAELARLRDELATERQARVEVDQRREAAEAELDLQRRARDEERQALEERGGERRRPPSSWRRPGGSWTVSARRRQPTRTSFGSCSRPSESRRRRPTSRRVCSASTSTNQLRPSSRSCNPPSPRMCP
jgi:hypothetical protein